MDPQEDQHANPADHSTLLVFVDKKSIMAEILRPGTFSAIIAIDPTMFPSQVNLKGPHDGHPLAQLTLKRRDHWKSRYGYGKQKGPGYKTVLR